MGLWVGLATFLTIGLFHPIVIKAEYYWGTQCWWIFLVWGVGSLAASFWVSSFFWSSILGVIGFSALWSIKELFEQKERVAKGWFPTNPNKKTKK